MPRDDWKGVVNQILYGLIFTRVLDEVAASRMADAMVERRSLAAGPRVYAAAIAQARRHRGPLTDELPTPHTEEAFRAYLELLATELDSRRPWRRTTS
ncbi:hypothetical protein E1193_15500 [Micromonospora sp. KC606]|uniref:hypothetical protein n=1 Tax=Micromonospora sp. KC606 TaxID=2530379 RepID=UPI00104862AC|nr:hypothetical protein [Micromonospora sp. KC606]TDC81180.1 hypothetical protein E1193_15500 [Micromonospora sp. KC606]